MRYGRQTIIDGFGDAAQERLRGSHALMVGCGALGCASIDLLARAGVGTLTLVDRDLVELTNLQRQSLFTEDDAKRAVPKAEAAKRRVAQVNSEVRVHACVEHLDARNVEDFATDCDVIVDGLDNYQTRYVLNDAAVKLGRAYVYAGAVATRGMSMPVLAGVARAHGLAAADAPCLRCIFPDTPPAGGGETCDTVGVFGPTVAAVGAHAAGESLKLLAGLADWLDHSLWQTDTRGNREHRTALRAAARADCPCCAQRQFHFLRATHDATAILCGRNAVQVAPRGAGVDLRSLESRLRAHGTFAQRDRLLVGQLHSPHAPDGTAIELTVFADGRAIVRGSTDPTFAQSIYDRFVGS
jgi:adenylyltransferase/sulfurtransferase